LTDRKALEREVLQAAAVKPAATLESIASLSDFEQEEADGFIRVQHHPSLPLDIYNYAEITQFQRHWTPVTLASRGLIVNRDTHEIVARPFSKFFNHGEGHIDPALLRGRINVTDKLDGSLGISYPTPDGLAISTRGSFASDQAKHATALYREQYEGKWSPKKGRTYLWEIVYPENRIVVSYGDTDDLILLGAVNIRTGKSIPADEVTEWPGARVEKFEYADMPSVLASQPRDNREGFVIHYPETDARIKYKYEDYVRLHRIVTGVNEKSIWGLMSSKQDIDSWLSDLPDEFVAYVNTNRDKIQGEYDTMATEARATYANAISDMPADATRKDYALKFARVAPGKQMSLMFNLLDNAEGAFEEQIWKRIEPKMS
jgi:RNA ligase